MAKQERSCLKPEHSPPSIQPELPNMPERETRPGLVILIAGGPGTGTSTLADKLGAFLKVHPGKIGEKFKKQSKIPVIGFVERTIDEVRKLDQKVMRRIRRTKPGQIKIVEARLGSWFAIKLRDKALREERMFPRIFTVLLHSDENDQIKRIHVRDGHPLPNLFFSPQAVRDYTRDRMQSDLAIFQETYPDLVGINPIDPKDPWSTNNYDMIINTSDKDGFSEDETFLVVIERLLDQGYLPKQGRFQIDRRRGQNMTQRSRAAFSSGKVFPAS